MKMEQTECYETSAYKFQTSGNYPEENIQHTEHSESLKSRMGWPVAGLPKVLCPFVIKNTKINIIRTIVLSLVGFGWQSVSVTWKEKMG